MAQSIDRLLTGRRFKPRMVRALRLVAKGVPTRAAAEAVGLKYHQDVAKYALELGLGVRRVVSHAEDAGQVAS